MTSTPTESRKASVTPVSQEQSPPATQIPPEEYDDYDEDDEQEEEEEEDGEVRHDEGSTQPVVEAETVAPRTSEHLKSGSISRRSSVVEGTPLATKQRRLSTLSNTQRASDIFRKHSFSGESAKSHVIGIPIHPKASEIKRRRSSAVGPKSSAGVAAKRRSVTIEPPSREFLATPPATQDNSVHSALTKSQGKQLEDSIQEDDDGGEHPKLESQEGPKSQTPTEGRITGIKIISAPGKADVLKKVEYDPNDPNDCVNIIKYDHRVSGFDQLTKSIYSLPPDMASVLSIDEDTFTMEDLCKPSLPIGKASSQFELSQQAKKRKLQERENKRFIREQARKLKRSIESFAEEQEENSEKRFKRENLDGEEPAANLAVQLKVRNGQIALDEESTVVDRHANTDDVYRERHDENPFENMVNSATYGRQRYTDKWTSDEVARFYKALGQWGTDFALIAQMFPHRTRKQVKAKFILEEKKRPRLIELALANKLGVQFDFDAYCADSNKTFSTLNEFNAKLEKLKEEHVENLKVLSAAREKAKEEDLQKQKKREHEIVTGQRTMTRQEKLTQLSKNETVIGSIDEVKKQRQEETIPS